MNVNISNCSLFYFKKSKVNSNVIPRIPERTKNTEADNNCKFVFLHNNVYY